QCHLYECLMQRGSSVVSGICSRKWLGLPVQIVESSSGNQGSITGFDQDVDVQEWSVFKAGTQVDPDGFIDPALKGECFQNRGVIKLKIVRIRDESEFRGQFKVHSEVKQMEPR